MKFMVVRAIKEKGTETTLLKTMSLQTPNNSICDIITESSRTVRAIFLGKREIIFPPKPVSAFLLPGLRNSE